MRRLMCLKFTLVMVQITCLVFVCWKLFQREYYRETIKASGIKQSMVYSLTSPAIVVSSVIQQHVTRFIQRGGSSVRESQRKARKKFFTLRERKVNPITISLISDNKRLCLDNDNKSLLLLIIVPSIPENYRIRDDIRKTAGTYIGHPVTTSKLQNNSTKAFTNFRLLFVIGQSSKYVVHEANVRESEKYGDLLVGQFTDSYKNLTRKMLVGLQWANNHCRGVRYILKMDEDVYIDVPRIMHLLQTESYLKNNDTIFGHVYSHGRVHRNGRWGVRIEEYPLSRYPDYISGTSYLISGHLLSALVHNAEYMPYIPMEDVFITGCLAKVSGARLRFVEGFSYWSAEPPDPCTFFRNKTLTATNVDSALRWKLWDVQNNYAHRC